MAKRRLIIFAAVVVLGGGVILGQMWFVSPPRFAPPIASITSTPPISKATGNPLHRVAWNGGSWYLQGVNVPWYNWGCDFGCNVTKNKTGGVSTNRMGIECKRRKAGALFGHHGG